MALCFAAFSFERHMCASSPAVFDTPEMYGCPISMNKLSPFLDVWISKLCTISENPIRILKVRSSHTSSLRVRRELSRCRGGRRGSADWADHVQRASGRSASGPSASRISEPRVKRIQTTRRLSSIGCTSTPGTHVKTRPSSSPTSMSTRSSSLTSIPDLLQTTVSRRTCACRLVVSTIPEMSDCYLGKHEFSFLERTP